jgi:hypothetical protein
MIAKQPLRLLRSKSAIYIASPEVNHRMLLDDYPELTQMALQAI